MRYATWLSRRAWARCIAPRDPITLLERSNVVIDCVKSWCWEIKCGIVREYVTLFCCRVSARCSAPWSSIWLTARPNVRSVCDTHRVKSTMRCSRACYLIQLQCDGQISDSLTTNLVVMQTECGQCLYGIVRDILRRVSPTLFRWRILPRCWAPTGPILLDLRSNVVSVWMIWSARDTANDFEELSTLFCCRPLAKCSVPCGPRSL